MISCLPDDEDSRKELEIMLKITGIYCLTDKTRVQHLINLVDYFIIKRDALLQIGGATFHPKRDGLDDLLSSHSGYVPTTERQRRFSMQSQPSRRQSAPSVFLSSFGDTKKTTLVRPDYLCLVTNYYRNGTVDVYLKTIETSKFSQEFLKIGHQLIHAVECFSNLPKMGYYHNDIKPQNILIDNECNVKLSDFGISESINFTSTRVQPKNLHPYSDPFILKMGYKVTEQTEIYSYGLTLLELWTIYQTELSTKLSEFFSLELGEESRSEILIEIIESISNDRIKKLITHCCLNRNFDFRNIKDYLMSQEAGQKYKIGINYKKV